VQLCPLLVLFICFLQSRARARTGVRFSQRCVCLQIFFTDGGTAFKLHRYRTRSCEQFHCRGQKALKLLTSIGECWRKFAVQQSSAPR